MIQSAAQIFYTTLIIIPFFLIQSASIVIALVRWNKHPEVSLLAIIASIMIFSARTTGSVYSWLEIQALQFHTIKPNYDYILFIFIFILILMISIANAFGYAAIFGWRNEQERTTSKVAVSPWVMLLTVGAVILVFITSVAFVYTFFNGSLVLPPLNFFIMLGLIFILGSPYFLIQSAGIVVATARWKRQPAVSSPVFIIVLLGSILISLPSLLQWALFWNLRLGYNYSNLIRDFFNLIDVMEILLTSALGVLTLAAIFGWRNGKDKTKLKGIVSPKVLLLTVSALILFFLDLFIGYPLGVLYSALSSRALDYRIFASIEILMFAVGSVFLLTAMSEQGKGKLKEIVHSVVKSGRAYCRTRLKDLSNR